MTLTPPTDGTPHATILASGRETLLDIPDSLLIDGYKAHGSLLLRGLLVDLDRFKQFVGRYCSNSVYNESRGRGLLDREHNIQTANIGTGVFPLHAELAREPWCPDICFFWCMTPPGAGGETTMCDGVEIVKQMPSTVYGAFAGQQLMHLQVAAEHELLFWLGSARPSDEQLLNPPPSCPYRFGRDGQDIVRTFIRPALHKPMFSDHLAFANFLLFARYARRRKDYPLFGDRREVSDELLADVKVVADRITHPLTWHAGDVLILDNTRFMHGRNAVRDPAVRRLATCFGYLTFAEPGPDEVPNAPWRRPHWRPPV
jgi:alpha-ketoglutarate-dependent taurine dioxygenase